VTPIREEEKISVVEFLLQPAFWPIYPISIAAIMTKIVSPVKFGSLDEPNEFV